MRFPMRGIVSFIPSYCQHVLSDLSVARYMSDLGSTPTVRFILEADSKQGVSHESNERVTGDPTYGVLPTQLQQNACNLPRLGLLCTTL